MEVAKAYVGVYVDTKKGEAEAKKNVEGMASGLAKTFAQIFGSIAFTAGIQKSISAASNLNETVNKIKVVFEDSATAITKWSTNSAQAMGLSQKAALDAAATFATFGKGAGLAGDDLVGFSQKLVGLSADLASFYNTSPEQAIMAIGAALRGESEPIRQYGVLLDDATLKQEAMNMGLYNGKGVLDQQARVLAAQAVILKQTSDAQGDFSRTSDGLANSQRIAKAETENAAASMGQAFLPVYTIAVQLISDLAKVFGELPRPVQMAVVALVGLVALSGPIHTVTDMLKTVRVAILGVVESAGGWKSAMGKLGTGLVAVGSVVALAIYAYQVYSNRKKEAAKRTNDLRDALVGEASAQNAALAELASHDGEVKRFLTAQRDLGISTDELTQYVKNGTGPVADLSKAWDTARASADGIYPKLQAFARLIGIDLAKDGWDVASAAARDFVLESRKLKAAQDDQVATQALVNAVTGEGTTNTQELSNATGEQTAQLSKQEQEAKAAQEKLDSFNFALEATTDQEELAKKAIEETTQALKDKAALLQEQADAQRAAADAVFALADAHDKFNDDIKNESQNIKDAKGDQEEIAAVYRQGARDAVDLADATTKVFQETAKADGAALTASQSTDIFNASLLEAARTANGKMRDAILDHIAVLNDIPEDIKTWIKALVDQDRMDEANRLLKDVSEPRQAEIEAEALTAEAERDLDNLARPRDVEFTAWLSNFGPGSHAMGGGTAPSGKGSSQGGGGSGTVFGEAFTGRPGEGTLADLLGSGEAGVWVSAVAGAVKDANAEFNTEEDKLMARQFERHEISYDEYHAYLAKRDRELEVSLGHNSEAEYYAYQTLTRIEEQHAAEAARIAQEEADAVAAAIDEQMAKLQDLQEAQDLSIRTAFSAQMAQLDLAAAAEKQQKALDVLNWVSAVYNNVMADRTATDEERARATQDLASAQQAYTDATIAGLDAQAHAAGFEDRTAGYAAYERSALADYLTTHPDPTGALQRYLDLIPSFVDIPSPGQVGFVPKSTANITVPFSIDGQVFATVTRLVTIEQQRQARSAN